MTTTTLTPFEAAPTPDFMSQATTLRLPGRAIDVVDAGVGTKASARWLQLVGGVTGQRKPPGATARGAMRPAMSQRPVVMISKDMPPPSAALMAALTVIRRTVPTLIGVVNF